MSDGECVHGLGPVVACVICNGREARERRIANTVERQFIARYTTRVDCGHQPEVGDVIARMMDGRIVCEECTP